MVLNPHWLPLSHELPMEPQHQKKWEGFNRLPITQLDYKLSIIRLKCSRSHLGLFLKQYCSWSKLNVPLHCLECLLKEA